MGLAVRDERLTLRVGTATLLLVACLGVGRVALDGCHTDTGFTVTVYFERLGGIQQGADIQVAGRVIGEVTGISLVPGHRVDAGHLLYPRGGVAVQIRIEDRYAHMAPVNGEVFIANKGLFGQKYLEIGAPVGGAAYARLMREGDEIRGIDVPDVDRAVINTYRNMQVAREFMDAIRPEWDEFARAMQALGDTVSAIEVSPEMTAVGGAVEQLVGEARRLRDNISSTGVEGASLERMFADAQELAQRFDTASTEVRSRLRHLGDELARMRERVPTDLMERAQVTMARLDESMARVQSITDNARAIMEMIRRGEGTLGALWNDPEFPEHAKELGRVIKRNPWRLIGRPGKR